MGKNTIQHSKGMSTYKFSDYVSETITKIAVLLIKWA